MSSVVITRDPDDIGRAIWGALQHIEIEPLIRGRLVAVKPNDTWASADNKRAVTQPDTLRAVIRYLKQFDPGELVVTGGSGAAETEDVFRIAGLMEVIKEERVTFFDHNRPPFEEVKLTYAPDLDVTGPQQTVMVNPRVLQYEALVVVSQLKMHATATVTMALKNVAMSYPAADYYGHPRAREYNKHHFFDDMHSFIAAMIARFPINLAITVGHPAMVGTGPVEGHTFETGLAIASTNAVAADTVGAALLGFEADAVHHLWEAGRMGLGETDIERIDFPAMSLKEARGIFTEAAYGQRLTF
ncbi:MAG: DUF362 domain-containing protein [Anaerolineae bacterium]|jgi:uncharacterized protein (DUF362 family)